MFYILPRHNDGSDEYGGAINLGNNGRTWLLRPQQCRGHRRRGNDGGHYQENHRVEWGNRRIEQYYRGDFAINSPIELQIMRLLFAKLYG